MSKASHRADSSVSGRAVAIILDRHTNGRAEAEDLYQDTFTVVIRKLRQGELRQPAKLPGFLAAVARNLAIEHYRKAARRKTDFDSEAVLEVASQGFDQLDRILEGERDALVRQVIEELNTPRDRTLLHRFYIAEEDKDCIAADFGLSSLQFNRVLHRARQRYKSLFEQRLKERRCTPISAAWQGCWGWSACGCPGRWKAEAMNHAYIEEHSLIERYHQGRLPAEEEARFEEHFAGCAHCQQELQAAREFRLGLKSLAAQESARKALVQIGLLAWLSRRSLRVQAGLLLAALILLFVPWVWLLGSNRQWNSRIEQARGDASDWQQRYESEQQSAAGLQERLEQLTASAAQPLINTPVFLLSALRSGSGQPAATVDLTQAGSHLVLAVDVGADPRIEGYRITISDSAGNRLWQESGLQPNALEAVMITFPAGFFSPGDYRLKTEGQRSGASAQELGNYSFQVVQAQ